MSAVSNSRTLLRFATAGSVDDGKSTLIGRLLVDSKSLLSDHLTAAEAASRKRGHDAVDLSLLTDGLIAEREQGITIDVAYRYFATAVRKFIIADSPGHAQYTRNMVTAASTADVAVLLVDASKGLQIQTRRHAYLSKWVGITRVVLAVNKIDLVDYSQERFEAIVAEFRAFSARLGFVESIEIPMSALNGDMVVERGQSLDWYRGPTLLEYLEATSARGDTLDRPFRLPIQRVVRVPRGQAQAQISEAFALREFRGYQGTIASGQLSVGDSIAVVSSGLSARVTEILVAERGVQQAFANQAITLALDQEIDVSRGDLFTTLLAVPKPVRDIDAEICWFDAEPLDVNRLYRIKHATRTTLARLAAPEYRIDVETLAQIPVPGTLAMNDIGRVRVEAQQLMPFEPYIDHRVTGSFIVIDESSNRTVAAGTVL